VPSTTALFWYRSELWLDNVEQTGFKGPYRAEVFEVTVERMYSIVDVGARW
jgi:hypothetical protein